MSNSIDEVSEAAEAEELLALPAIARRLLTELNAPRRLIAHLHLVHDVAVRLTDQCTELLANVRIDSAAVAFGAATHDIGKALFPAELNAAGSRHELGGEAWMIAQGVAPPLARFARTHGFDPAARDLALDDILVIAADKLWKGKRVTALEERLVHELALSAGQDYWDVWTPLSEVFDLLVENADRRLAWQGRFSADG